LLIVNEENIFAFIKENIPETPDAKKMTNMTHDVEYMMRFYYGDSGNIMLIEDELLGLFYVTFQNEQTIKIVGGKESRIRTGILRIIRGLWMWDSLANYKALIIHGCALEKNGRGIVIIGEKHAGKTTSLLNLASKKKYNIVANDRLFLTNGTSSAGKLAIGIPTMMNLKWKTVGPFPQVHHLQDTPHCSMWDLAQALHVDVKEKVKISTVIFISYDNDFDEPVFHKISEKEAYNKLDSHLFSFGKYEYLEYFRIVKTEFNIESKVDENLFEGISCFQLRWNGTNREKTAHLMDKWCQKKTDY